MKIYIIKRTQFLPLTIEKAWDSFSTPNNLEKITPKHIDFQILYKSGEDKMYHGQLIQYLVKILPFMPMHWVTEITRVNKPPFPCG